MTFAGLLCQKMVSDINSTDRAAVCRSVRFSEQEDNPASRGTALTTRRIPALLRLEHHRAADVSFPYKKDCIARLRRALDYLAIRDTSQWSD